MSMQSAPFHTLSVLVEDKPGILAKVVGLFSRRGFNILSLAVGNTHTPGFSRITIVVRAERHSIDQVMKQLHKLINTHKVMELYPNDSVERILAMIKVRTSSSSERADVLQVVDIFRSRTVDVGPHSLTIEATGTRSKIDALLEMLRPFGVIEMVQSGSITIGRGSETITERLSIQERRARAQQY